MHFLINKSDNSFNFCTANGDYWTGDNARNAPMLDDKIMQVEIADDLLPTSNTEMLSVMFYDGTTMRDTGFRKVPQEEIDRFISEQDALSAEYENQSGEKIDRLINALKVMFPDQSTRLDEISADDTITSSELDEIEALFNS
jgi:hypothetical protein